MQDERPSTGLLSEAWTATAVRFAGYTLVIIGFALWLPRIIDHAGVSFFYEDGPLEWVQFALLAGAGAMCAAAACAAPHFRTLAVVLASVSAFAAVRELDSLLDRVIPWIGWKIGFVLLLYAAGAAYGNRRRLLRQFARFLDCRAFAVLWAGAIIALPLAQLIGHGPFLQQLMGEHYFPAYKRVIEESAELVGYFILFAGSVETFAQARRLDPPSLDDP